MCMEGNTFHISGFQNDDGDVPLCTSRTSKAMSLDVPPMECKYLSLLVLLEHLLAQGTSTVITKTLQPSSLGKATVIINFAKHF